ncbi:hypothetical protein [Roseiterribacter gracilis]|uniref:Uncharacterized protein n=1 Tax=Roseiterribacter gracilis TaxID=2812848 RepID=A0A8S8XEH0_9PROT|nr:hypothetical protein TMPK1_40400 [Rhodospirillales bacterium TMPK1]
MQGHVDPYLRLTLSSGSGRVMNLHRVTRRLLAKGEGGKRFFGTTALNDAYLIKDVDPRIDLTMDRERIRVRTRIYLPFDPANAFEGGQMIDVGARDYRSALEQFADVRVPERKAALDTDMAMLGVMDSLPSLAPFLVRDRLERAGYPVDDRYVQVSTNEWDEISHFIRTQFRKIILAVFGTNGSGNDAKLDQLLQKLWDLEDKPALTALAAAFRLPTENPESTFYAWKGVIYFTYEYGTFAERIRKFLLWLKNDATVPAWIAAPIPQEVNRLRDTLFARMTTDLDEINQRLAAYQQSFDDLFGGGAKGAQPFIEFLSKASQHFNVLGVAIGRVQHVTLVWDRFNTALKGKAPKPETLVELLAALAQVLGEPANTNAIAPTVATARI